MGLMSAIFGDMNAKEVKKIEKIVEKIEALDAPMQKLSDEELRAKTDEFKERLASGKDDLDSLLPEAFAVAREGAARVLNMKPFHVQLIGGVVLHQGNIAEMKTGEGKTLVATLPVYLNALEGKGVHVVTVNDYLAKRDAEWMGQLYNFLGLSVGCVIHEVMGEDRKNAYLADITYGTNNEFGFDYLRDNMVIYKEQLLQRELNYAIVDEVDSILIDEARTPLIISGMGGESTELYSKADRFVRGLRPRIISQDEKVGNNPVLGVNPTDTDELNKGYDYTVDEKEKTVALTEEGIEKAERYFGIENFADPENMDINHHVLIAMKAHSIMHRDIDYIVNEGEVNIVDEFTGRIMYGRRYSDGLHQAIEAKEGIDVRSESKTLATITLQNYFRMYNKLAGMTGTAKTEEEEFMEIYNMSVVEIPTNKPVIRNDYEDSVYATQKGKFKAVVESIIEHHATGQPVLVGTVSVEKSEMLSEMLKRRGIKHNVLNAKQHMREAEIVAEAGKKDAVTIATNMAGRGTDILLGGSEATEEEREEVKALGGLHIIGTERHEARRIDNQLRGRSGRQGDPGSSQFFVALDDDLMRLFGGERIQALMARLNVEDDDPLEASMLTKTIENAQKKVEGRNYSIRRYVLQYDDVMNRQRSTIYQERRRVLDGEDLREHVLSMMRDIADEIATTAEQNASMGEEYNVLERIKFFCPQFRWDTDTADAIYEGFVRAYEDKEKEIGPIMREIERMLLLRIVDTKWMDHIDAMEDLKTGIGLQSIGQKDPAQAYANEGGEMFDMMVKSICEDMVRFCFNVSVNTNTERKSVVQVGNSSKQEAQSALDEDKRPKEVKVGGHTTITRNQPKIGRNDPCPCGSGKKYKNCCGKNQ
jgi:preprotein translocase subunit SecA